MKKLTLTGLALALLGSALVGCTQEAREKYDAAGDNLAKGASQTGDAVATDAKVGAEAAKDAAQEAGAAVDNTTMTGRVRAAIDAADNLTIHDLNVDTIGADAGEKKIVLKGRADNEEAKKRAEQVASGIAGSEYKIDNQIVVGGA